ncbi:putative secreted protein [Trichoderma guizhouense]|uniref:Putative secreted protein n=1 Tax=Trichoderma guizhouense TaxID=1491466 RepID=A0A1T3CQ20_9HYPO|nr:putative secreted protein [Trichoderma guizhouense]
MKSAAVAAFGLFAGLASASSPIRHLHFPRSNTTTAAVDDAAPTTLTVIATSVHTVISCAPTVTNCPARLNSTGAGSLPESARSTVVVTDTIVLATTVCPVAEASSISSSLQAAHSSGLITGSTIKATPPAAVTPPPNAGVSVTDVVTDKTLTYTIGKGAGASVVTTTIQATTKKTITLTSTLGNVQPVQTGSGSSGSNTGGNAPPANAPPANGNGSGEGSCASTVTVTVAKETVTVPASTVYVTIAPSSCDSGSAPAVTDKSTDNSGSGSSGSNSGSNSGSGSSGSGSEGSGNNNGSGDSAASATTSTPCPTDITTTVRATVTVQPYPINNGTVPTGGAAQPTASGFARRLRR